MLIYKDKYKVVKNLDSDGRFVNHDDTYIPCRKNVQIYRYNDNTLAIQFNSKQYAKNRIKDCAEVGVKLKLFVEGDYNTESVYLFNETELDKVSSIVKARTRRKLNLTEEQRNELRLRLEKMREKKSLSKN